jgi:peptidoglycan hydrolase-like protein with peptidoglycan-binding domain
MFTNEQRLKVGAAARAFGYPEPHVLAVTHVESDGVVSALVNNVEEPLIRFEGHIFFRRLAGAKRQLAVSNKLADPKALKIKNPKSQAARWAMLKRAMAIDEDAALESTSWGVGQVMGFNWKDLGYSSVQELVQRARSGLDGQVELMLRYVRANRLDDELIAGQWAPFARGYNGPNYKANQYDTKLAAAAAMYGGMISEPNGMLRMGSKGRRVRELQALLLRAGYAIKQDGDFGTTTKDALVAFQKKSGIKADGIYGPETESALATLRQAPEDVPGKQKTFDISKVKKATATIAGGGTGLVVVQEKLQDVSGKIAGIGITSQILDYVQTGLTIGITGCIIGGILYGIYGWVESKQTEEA